MPRLNQPAPILIRPLCPGRWGGQHDLRISSTNDLRRSRGAARAAAARSSLAQSLPLVAVPGRQLHAWLGCKDRSRSTSSRRREVSACQVDHGWTDGTAGRPGAAASADAACRPGHDAVQYWAERNLPSVGRGRPGAACMDDDDGLGWPGGSGSDGGRGMMRCVLRCGGDTRP